MVEQNMMTLCPSCGTPTPADAHRCPECGGLAPLPFDDEPVWSDEPPWAIPIRDAAPTRDTSRVGRPSDPLRPVLYAVLALAAFIGVVAVGAQAFGGGDGSGPPEPEVAGDTVVAADRSASSIAPSTTAAAAATTTTTSPPATTTTEASTTTTRAPTTTRLSPSTTSVVASSVSAPRLSSSFSGGWIAQLTSVPATAGGARVDDAWRVASAYSSGAVVTRSDEWVSLQPGYWVVVDPGPFGSAADVRSHCEAIGHADRDDCLPRELTGRR